MEGGRVLTMGFHEIAKGEKRACVEKTTKGCLYLSLTF